MDLSLRNVLPSKPLGSVAYHGSFLSMLGFLSLQIVIHGKTQLFLVNLVTFSEDGIMRVDFKLPVSAVLFQSIQVILESFVL